MPLAAWTWPGTRPDGGEIADILITHTPAVTGSGTTETAEPGCGGLSAALGGLTGAREGVPSLSPLRSRRRARPPGPCRVPGSDLGRLAPSPRPSPVGPPAVPPAASHRRQVVSLQAAAVFAELQAGV